ncbi:DotU family type IV/VI secretion system protein [Teredinibacter sp. KSP-S5-2]|uniref:DotU family type IV/VI secretion system protein n=1 Tax=Teredinibacter sp. KSP-S5-2 TaxID=3034506 RepID=UPI0029344A6F|nr:DotU family type IV/VI secretion system protein [Teredinibacter sp. KSP-S5-2]WNO11627.1 DotU family type IV/VI secretion system protein [Teredinibacter sp. KSP-S5-2]
MKMPFEEMLLTLFFDYLEELVDIKENINNECFDGLLAKDYSGSEKEKHRCLAINIRDLMLRTLNHYDNEIKTAYSKFEYEIFLKVKYVLAAVTDETFIHLFQWDGSTAWLNNLLELKAFGTSISGSVFFDEVDTLLQNTSGEKVFTELAKIYYLALQIGFRGIYRNKCRDGQLKKIRRSLLAFIGETSTEKNSLTSSGRGHTKNGKGVRLTPLVPWVRAGFMALGVYLLVAAIVWITSIEKLKEIVS